MSDSEIKQLSQIRVGNMTAMSWLAGELWQLQNSSDWSTLENILRNADLKADTVWLIGILRHTYKCRAYYLEAWQDFLYRVRDELDSRCSTDERNKLLDGFWGEPDTCVC